MRTNTEPGPFLRAYVETANEILPRYFAPDCCLNATRVCIDAMKAFGVKAEPQSVHMEIRNRIFVQHVALNGGATPSTEVQLERWVAAGGWAIGTDTQHVADDGKWAGHLVAIVQGWIVDSSSGQFSRPQKSMFMPFVFAGLASSRFLKGKDSVVFETREGAHLMYHRRNDESWRKTPGFRAHSHNNEVIARVVDAMRSKLGRKSA